MGENSRNRLAGKKLPALAFRFGTKVDCSTASLALTDS